MFVINIPQNSENNEIPNWVNFLDNKINTTDKLKRRRIIEGDTDSE